MMKVIPHDGTSNEAAASAVDVGSRQGKTCVVVKDVPGFYVNRWGIYLRRLRSVIVSIIPTIHSVSIFYAMLYDMMVLWTRSC